MRLLIVSACAICVVAVSVAGAKHLSGMKLDSSARNAPPSGETLAAYEAPAADGGESSGGFPKAGTYEVVTDGFQGRQVSSSWMDVSTRRAFEEVVARNDGSNCRDRKVYIAGGSFHVSMTCDAPDGDIHNVGIRRDGTYSDHYLRMNVVETLWGNPIEQSATYTLRPGRS